MSGRIKYGVAPGYGPKNSMAAKDTVRIAIPVNKDEIYEDARAILHKYGDARLNSENSYHVSVVQADDLDEDTRLFDRYYTRAFRDAVKACSAYYRTSTSNTGYISITPGLIAFPSTFTAETDNDFNHDFSTDYTVNNNSDSTRDVSVMSDDAWTLQLTQSLSTDSGNSIVPYLYAIGLLMPSTWNKDSYNTLCDSVYDYILYFIVSEFLKVTEPAEHRLFKENAAEARFSIKECLESREPFTRYTEIKPF